MGKISKVLLTMLIIMAISSSIKLTSIHRFTKGGKISSCEFTTELVDNTSYVACDIIKSCKYVSKLPKFNETCFKLSMEINVINCCDIDYVIILPAQQKNSACYDILPKSWCDFMTSLKKIIVTSTVFVITYIMKIPIIYILRFIDLLTGKFASRASLKDCHDCNAKYRFSHLECKTHSTERIEYNLIFYSILILILFVTPIVADKDFDRYEHGDYTEFIVKDRDNHMTEFYNNQNHIKVTILSSYLKYDLSYDHDVIKKVKDFTFKDTFSCKSTEKCIEDLKKSDPNITDDQISSVHKAHDGFKCIFTDVIICAACAISWEFHSKVYTVVDVKPVINIKLQINNDEPLLVMIDSFEDYADDNYYIRYLESKTSDIDEVVVKDGVAYSGNICRVPERGCFGPHVYKDGKISVYYDPKLIDDGHYSSSYELQRCTIDDNTNIKQLKKEGLYNNNTLIKNTEFGHFSIGVRKQLMLDDSKCEKLVKVVGINHNGCYNCAHGFDIEVKYKYKGLKCGKVICSTPVSKAKTYVSDEYKDTTKLNLHSDSRKTLIKCNDFSKDIILEEYKIQNHTTTSNSFRSEVSMSENLWDILDHLSVDIKKRLFILTLTVLMVYLITRALLNFNKTKKRYKKHRIVKEPYRTIEFED
nr:glycoprotein precursor [Callicarpa mosaic-associated virus 1]